MAITASALAGGDCIDGADAMRGDGAGRVLGLHCEGAVHPWDLPAQLMGAEPEDQSDLGGWFRTRQSESTARS